MSRAEREPDDGEYYGAPKCPDCEAEWPFRDGATTLYLGSDRFMIRCPCGRTEQRMIGSEGNA